MSFILNDVADHRISDATRDAVLAAVRDLDYRPNRTARDLATGTRSALICFVPASQLGEGALRLVGELTAALGRFGYSLAVYFESSDRSAFSALVRVLQPDLVFPLYGRLPDWVDDQVLSGARAFTGFALQSDRPDPGAKAQVEHLVARGHRTIAYVGTQDASMSIVNASRRASIAIACAQLNLEEPVAIDVQTTGADLDEVLRVMRTAAVTGVCCFNDEVAFMFMNRAHALGFRIPDDLAVVGYDAIPLAAWSVPPLSTVAWDTRGAAAVFADGVISSVDPTHTPRTLSDIDDLVAAHVIHRKSS